MDADRYFRETWPATAHVLRGWLVRSGARPHDAEDVVQETAARLLRAWHRIDSDTDIAPLARTIAANVYRDELKSARRRETPGDVPDSAAVAEDVERRVVARLGLDRVVRAIAALPAAQRSALDASLARDGADPRAPAERMALMRARRALLAAMQRTSAVLAAIRLSRPGTRRTAALAAVTVGVAVSMSLLPWLRGAEPGSGVTPGPDLAAVVVRPAGAPLPAAAASAPRDDRNGVVRTQQPSPPPRRPRRLLPGGSRFAA